MTFPRKEIVELLDRITPSLLTKDGLWKEGAESEAISEIALVEILTIIEETWNEMGNTKPHPYLGVGKAEAKIRELAE